MSIAAPDLGKLAAKLRELVASVPHRERSPLLRAAGFYERAATVPSAHYLREGVRLGDLLLVEQVEGDEHGRLFLVRCLRCGEDWYMRGAKARRLYLWGRNPCRTCRRSGR